jgi:hypothetical protein
VLLIQTNHHLSKEFVEGHYKNAVDDADRLIAQTAVDCALSSEVIVIGEDTDMLVLLIHHVKFDANVLHL